MELRQYIRRGLQTSDRKRPAPGRSALFLTVSVNHWYLKIGIARGGSDPARKAACFRRDYLSISLCSRWIDRARMDPWRSSEQVRYFAVGRALVLSLRAPERAVLSARQSRGAWLQTSRRRRPSRRSGSMAATVLSCSAAARRAGLGRFGDRACCVSARGAGAGARSRVAAAPAAPRALSGCKRCKLVPGDAAPQRSRAALSFHALDVDPARPG